METKTCGLAWPFSNSSANLVDFLAMFYNTLVLHIVRSSTLVTSSW